jgi:hypothetical protein
MDDHDNHRSLHHDDTVDDNHDRGGSKAIGIVATAASGTSHSLRNDDDDDNSSVIIITPQQCIELFSTLHESVSRSESILGDVDFMFQQDNRLLNDMMLIKSIVKDDKIASSLYASTATTSTTTTSAISNANATNDATVGDSNTTHCTSYQANNINSGIGDVVRAPSLSLLPTKSEQQSIISIYSLLDNNHTPKLNYWGKFLHLFFNSTVNTVEHSSSITTRKKKKAINIELSQVTANVRSRTPREVPLIISPLSQYEDRYIGNKNGIVSKNSSSSSTNVDTELFRCITQAEDECIQRCFLHTYSAMSDLKIRRMKVIQKDSFKLMQDAMSSVKKMELMYAHALHDSSQENQRIQSDLVYYGIIRSRDCKDYDGDVHQVDGDNNPPPHHHAHSQDSVSAANAYPSTASTMLEGMNSATTNDQSTDDSKKRSLFQSSYGPFTKRRK